MQTAEDKIRSTRGTRADPFTAEAKARRQKRVAAINASHSKQAEAAETTLVQYLNSLYPETVVPHS